MKGPVPVPFDVASVRAQLPSRRVEWFSSLDSTMLKAAQMARAHVGDAHNPHRTNVRGLVIGAEEQTAGMGRQGRTWHSASGEGLYVSIVLDTKPAPILMLALGLATQDAIKQTTNLSPDLRWPNDVLITGSDGIARKCAGILAQAERDAVIAGIGINVHQTHFPADLETPATSLHMQGARITREDLLIELVDAVDYYAGLAAEEITRLFTAASSYANGKRVRTETGGRIVEGITCGLNPAGFLLIRESDGTERTILTGGVRPV